MSAFPSRPAFVAISCLICILLSLALHVVNALASLSRNRVFFAAEEPGFKYRGRWLNHTEEHVMEAGFSGSSIDFTITNTTSAILVVLNSKKLQRRDHDLSLTPLQQRLHPESPVDVLVTINDSQQITKHQQFSWIVLGRDLNRTVRHSIRVSLHSNSVGSLQIGGLLLDSGGMLIERNVSSRGATSAHISLRGGSKKTMVEVIGSSAFIGTDAEQVGTRAVKSWPSILDDMFTDTTVNAVELQNHTCRSSQCTTSSWSRLNDIQKVFFRAGPPGTHLYNHFWPFEQSKDIPVALVLSIGVFDFDILLAETLSNKHQTAQLVDHFARRYSVLIQTIRRSALSPATLTTIYNSQSLNHSKIDESYFYNSAASTIPILLVLQPLPNLPRTRQLKNLVHHATHKVIAELKWHIGDRYTHVIDSAGWLNDADFLPDDDMFGLSQTGHHKVAYHMALQLCPYMSDLGCPFEKHEDFIGNMFDPETENIGKLMEEKNILKIKEVFGIQ